MLVVLTHSCRLKVRTRTVPIDMIESIKLLNYKPVYNRTDGIPILLSLSYV